MTKKIDINDVDAWSDGKLQLAVGLCEKIGIVDLFNKHLDSNLGRPSDIPAGVEAAIMIASIADDGYKALSAFQDYYRDKDLEGIFHHSIELSQLNDSRFGHFLDDFYDAGCRQIFMEASSLAFSEYGLSIKSINYDTTSKVMWGEYKTTNQLDDAGKNISQIYIDFGHSKQKRNDKKQIKIGVGTANGIVADAKVLSGNKDDKTYNNENLDDLDKLISTMDINRNEFYYIADSALFTKSNIKKANGNKISFITRMPDNYKLAKELMAEPLSEDAQIIEIEKSQGKISRYKLVEAKDKYNGHPCNFAVIYSEQLEETKEKTCQKNIKKEKDKAEKSLKKYKKRRFKCQADADKEIELLNNKLASKQKYHDINFSIKEEKIRRPGRPSKNPENDIAKIEYKISSEIILNDKKVAEYIRKECTFILASNDLSISGERILREYKTQIDVEKRFRNLKSPQFMNSLFLNSPKRIEALVYLLLIVLMILTIAEKVVRNKLKENDDIVLGMNNRKLKQPTLKEILRIINRVRIISYIYEGKVYRKIKRLDDSCKKVINALGISKDCFAWNSE